MIGTSSFPFVILVPSDDVEAHVTATDVHFLSHHNRAALAVVNDSHNFSVTDAKTFSGHELLYAYVYALLVCARCKLALKPTPVGQKLTHALLAHQQLPNACCRTHQNLHCLASAPVASKCIFSDSPEALVFQVFQVLLLIDGALAPNSVAQELKRAVNPHCSAPTIPSLAT